MKEKSSESRTRESTAAEQAREAKSREQAEKDAVARAVLEALREHNAM